MLGILQNTQLGDSKLLRASVLLDRKMQVPLEMPAVHCLLGQPRTKVLWVPWRKPRAKPCLFEMSLCEGTRASPGRRGGFLAFCTVSCTLNHVVVMQVSVWAWAMARSGDQHLWGSPHVFWGEEQRGGRCPLAESRKACVLAPCPCCGFQSLQPWGLLLPQLCSWPLRPARFPAADLGLIY